MLHLLGGAPRAGKTTISHKFTRQTRIPSLGLDYLKMGLARGLPHLGIDPLEGDRITAGKLWPVVRGMAHTYVENREDILLEGACILPEYAAELCRDLPGQIHSCFVGYADIDTAAKVEQLRRYAGDNGDWSSDDDDEAIENVEFLKSFSQEIRLECERYGLRYFESSPDHWSTIDAVLRYLCR